MGGNNSFSATVGKRKRVDDEESDGGYKPRIVSGTGAREVDSGRSQSVSNSLNHRTKVGEGSRSDECIRDRLKKQRRTEDGSGSEEATRSLGKRRSKAGDENGVNGSISSHLNTQGTEKREGNGSDERIKDSLKDKRRQKEEREGLDKNSSGSWKTWRKETAEGNGPDENIDDSQQEWRPRKEEDDESDADYKGTNIDRAGHDVDADVYKTLSGESEEEEDRSPDVGVRTLVKKRRKKKDKKEDLVDMSSVDGVWASSLKGPHLDLMVSLKHLAEVRLMNTKEDSLSSCLTPASLRTIGIILEELLKDRMATGFPPSNIGHKEENRDAQPQQDG